MSKNSRRLSYWTINFVDQQDKPVFDRDLLIELLQYVKKLKPKESLINDRRNYRAMALKSLQFEDVGSIKLCKIAIKSCKYNHSPDFMSSVDGSERPSSKTLSEGDEELTHLCMRIDSNEAYIVFEQRLSGVTFSRFVEYLNHFYKQYKREKGIQNNTKLDSFAVVIDDFEGMLERVQRIPSAELYTTRQYFGNEFLGLMNIGNTIRDEVFITVKAERMGSLSKDRIRQVFLELASGNSMITRMRLKCKDTDDVSIILDTINMKKNDEISVKLDSNGVVDTVDIFEKMKEIVVDV